MVWDKILSMIQLVDVTKRYDDTIVVDHMDLQIDSGEIVGIIGHNGAGKSTTMKMIAGLVEPTSGHVQVMGHDMQKESIRVKQRIGYLPEESSLYEAMTARQYLLFFSELYQMPRQKALQRIDGLLNSLGLADKDKLTGEFSKGMKRKTAIARALLHDPDLLILDEPNSGLDPLTSFFIINYLKNLKREGKTILLSAHNLFHVETICDRVGIIKNGKLLVFDSMEAIRSRLGQARISGSLPYRPKAGLRAHEWPLHLSYRRCGWHRPDARNSFSERLDTHRSLRAGIGAGGDLRQIDDKYLIGVRCAWGYLMDVADVSSTNEIVNDIYYATYGEIMITAMEELSLNAWPAHQTLLYDGWVLRFADGYTKRANSVNPLHPSTLDLEEKIAFCERIYQGQKLDVVYKLTSASHPGNLDEALSAKGYRKDSPTSVQLLELDSRDLKLADGVELKASLSDPWLDAFCRMNAVNDRRRESLRRILVNIIPQRCFASLTVDSKVIAAGLGVLQSGFIGLFDIVVDHGVSWPGLWTADCGKHSVLGKTEWSTAILSAGHAQQSTGVTSIFQDRLCRKISILVSY